MPSALEAAQKAFTHDVVKLLAYVLGLGWSVTFGEVYRTKEQQKIYVDRGKSKTMNSNHLKRLAVDLNFYTPDGALTYRKEDLQTFGDYWEGLNPSNSWGGNWKSFSDTPHFERRA